MDCTDYMRFMSDLWTLLQVFSLPIELLIETSLATFTCARTLNNTWVKPVCQQNSLSRNDVILSIMEQWLCLTPFPALTKHTHTNCVPLAPGDRCVTAARRKRGDPTWQNEWPISQVAGWLTDRETGSSLTVTLAAFCKCGSILKRRKRVDVSLSVYTETQAEMLRRTETPRHPRCRLDMVCLLPPVPQTQPVPGPSFICLSVKTQ